MYFIEALLTFGYRYRILTVLLLIAISVGAYYGAKKVTIDTDLSTLISSKIDRSLFDELAEEFNAEDVTVIYVEDADLFTPDKLARLKELSDEISQVEGVDELGSIFSAETLTLNNRGQLVSEKIITTLPETDEQAHAIRDKTLDHPLLEGALIASNGKATAINITLSESIETTDDNLAIFEDMQDILRDYQEDFQYLFQMGDPRLTNEQFRSMLKDMYTLGPIAVAFLVVILFLFFTNTSSFILPILTSALSFFWTLGFIGYLGIPINILIVMLPTLVLVMGATEDVHMLSSYLESFEEVGSTKTTRYSATRIMMKKVSLPIILTSVTTWFGFTVSQFSDITMVKHFSQAASFSFIANAVSTILVVPCYLATVGPKPKASKEGFNPFEGLTDFITMSVKRFPLLIVASSALIVGIMLVYTGKVYVNTAPLSFFDKEFSLVQDADKLHESLAGINTFFIALEVEENNGFKESENLDILENVTNQLNAYAEVDSATGLTDYMGYLEETLPDKNVQAVEYLKYFRKDDLQKVVNNNYTRTNITIRHNLQDSHELDQLLDTIDNYLQSTLPEEMAYYITGEDLLYGASVAELLKSQVVSMLYLVAAIFVVVSILFTSKIAGLIALVPNMVPLIILFGIMGLLSLPLNPGTTLVAVILISIAVDDTIHLFHAYIHECRHSLNNKDAIIKALITQIRPITTTSTALALGFGALMFSDIKINASFGMLAAISILLAMLCDLLLTPVILANVRIVSLYNLLSMHLIKNVVEKSSLFKDMTPYEVKKAILLCAMIDYPEGENIIVQDQEDNEMYLLVKGHVEVYRTDSEGNEHVLAELSPGEVFGEMAYIQKVRRTANVRTTAPASVVMFNSKQLTKNMRAYPKIAYKMSMNIARILSERLQVTTEKATT